MSVRLRVGLAALSLVGSAAFVSCGDGAGPLASSDETARADASEALASVEELRSDLEAEVDDLAARLADATADDERLKERLSSRLRYLTNRRERALQRMTRRLEAVDGAASVADSALAEARSVARELSVLDERLDYHLKNH